MAIVQPFKAVTYNPSKVKDLSQVITPPYDVIPAGDDEKYRNRSPYNLAHVDLSHGPNDDYSQSKATIESWFQHQIWIEDTKPHFYLYQQDYSLEGKHYSRRTLISQVALCDFSEGVVRPHENTHGKHKTDRLKLLEKTRMNLSHVFGMVKDPEGFLASRYEEWSFRPPLASVTFDDGVKHSLWRISEEQAKGVSDFFKDKPIYIVDGHHRYESTLGYARSVGALGNAAHPANYMLFAIANCYDPGLVVLPTHRWVKASELPKSFTRSDVEKSFTLTPTPIEKILEFTKAANDEPRFGLYAWGETFMASAKHWESEAKTLGRGVAQLAVTWSDEFLLRRLGGIEPDVRVQKIVYEKNASAAWEKKGPSDTIIFHAPPFIEAITRVSDEKGFMPQKSTYFYPKLFGGLTMRKAY